MDQRVGVHDLDRGRQLRYTSGGRPIQGFVRREHERRAQPLPCAEQTVADDLVPGGRRCQYRIDPGARVREISS